MTINVLPLAVAAALAVSGPPMPPVSPALQRSPQPWVELAWNDSPGTNIVGYNIYYGPRSGVYTNVASCGNTTNTVIGNLVPGAIYFFAATSINSIGLESVYSAEISYTVPEPAPVATNFNVSVSVLQSADMTNWITVTNLGAFNITNTLGSNVFWRALMHISPQ